MRGRPPKSTAALKLTGTFRKDRHAGRCDSAWPVGSPEPCADLSGPAAELWRLIVESTPPGVLSPLDAAALTALCEWFGLYRRYMARLAADEGHPAFNLRCAAQCWNQFSTLAAAFGLNPAARASLRISIPPPAPPESAASEFFKDHVEARR